MTAVAGDWEPRQSRMSLDQAQRTHQTSHPHSINFGPLPPSTPVWSEYAQWQAERLRILILPPPRWIGEFRKWPCQMPDAYDSIEAVIEFGESRAIRERAGYAS